MTKNTTNRWLVVLGAMLLQVCIGSIYSWSLFNEPLVQAFGWQSNEVVLTFSIAVFVFAFTTIFSGRLQDKIGPRIVASIGGLLYGIGLLLTSTATSITQLYIYYGLIAGIGVGFAYVCPLSTCVKWFPERKGFITGLVVGSFGLGSLVFKSIIEFLLVSKGLSGTFFYLGIIYFVCVVVGAQFLKVPPEGYAETMKKNNVSSDETNFTVREMLKTKSFYLIWVMYLFATMSGLLVIGLAKDIGIELANLEPHVAANAVSMIAFFNASGRLIWGSLSDKLGRIRVVSMMLAITAVGMILMSITSLSFITFFVYVAAITFCFGGFLSVLPTVTGEFYGMKNLGANYGIVYQAYGLSALVGPMVVTYVGGLKPTFIIAAILAIIGGVMTLMIKPPLSNALLTSSSEQTT
ncbi:L-lactate MFS transporter [Clostridium formicaceticum]|uniref:MFS transporter n=1 Tax=Clostridium formicaceticum TaxID=1497 RepID=A0AAC9RQU1_9CLOT|nr:OFA family MFS transporter [Clostridium formicaceticum]AOY75283.1 MFS transporter [Clostridium formicaceticum]ARE89722.1 putative MFS-type transporter YhjX [Clostridium formicaceticum]